jgi:hypothetical protein
MPFQRCPAPARALRKNSRTSSSEKRGTAQRRAGGGRTNVRDNVSAGVSVSVRGSGRDSDRDQLRGLRRSRSSVTVAGHGHGPSRCGVLGPPKHRPAVAVGARRASAPARLPSATRIANPTRSPTVASGRLDGLPPPRCTLLRHALPEGAPLENVLFANSEVHRHILKDGTPTVAPLLVLHRARESRAALSTRLRAPAGVPSTVLCRNVRVSTGTMPWGAPPGMHPGEARHSHQEGRRDARRWPSPHEDDGRLTPPQGGEPEREARRAPNATEGR